MKKEVLLNFLFAVAILTASGQSSTYYYAFNEQLLLNKLADKGVLKFKAEIEHPNLDSLLEAENYPLSEIVIENVDRITFKLIYSDIEILLEDLQNNEQIHTALPAYITETGSEIGLTDEILVKPLESSSSSQVNQIFANKNLIVIKEEFNYILLSGSYGANSLELANELMESNLFKFSVPNFIAEAFIHHIPNDEYFNYQWGFHNIGQVINDGHTGTPDADIDAPEAWNLVFNDPNYNPNIIVAVYDEGVTDAHPDLPSYRQIRLNGSNFVWDIQGNDPNDPSPWTVIPSNHGNACAGLIGATMDNNEGIAGLAPDCKIMPLKGLFSQGISMNRHVDAINFAWQNGADIINNSWGLGNNSPNFWPPLVQGIEDATKYGRNGLGTIVVFSAGNTANHVQGNNGYVSFPANVYVPGVLSVGASNRNDLQSNYSPADLTHLDNYKIDLTAPSHHAYPWQIPGATINNNLGVAGLSPDSPLMDISIHFGSQTLYMAFVFRSMFMIVIYLITIAFSERKLLHFTLPVIAYGLLVYLKIMEFYL
jgi:hypothetical protein